MNARHIIGIAAASLASLAAAPAAPDAPVEERVALGKTTLPRATVERAYQRVSGRYVYVMPGDRLARAGSVGARRIEGTVMALASGRRAIIDTGSQRCAVALRFGANPVKGERIRVMAAPSNVPTFSYEASADTRESLPQFNDYTLSFEQFVQQVRRGAHFPEAPELGTQPNRVGLFQLGRGDRNKVAGLVAERERQDATASPAGGRE